MNRMMDVLYWVVGIACSGGALYFFIQFLKSKGPEGNKAYLWYAIGLAVVAAVRFVSFRRLHHRLQILEQQEALHRERARPHRHRAAQLVWIDARLEHRKAPRMSARLRVDVEAEQRGVTAGVREERERSSADGALDDGRVGRAAHVHPADVTDARSYGVPGHDETVGALGGERQERQREHRGRARRAAPRHSGRCCRRNCSISSTSSDAGGRSLPVPGGVGSSSASRDSSLRM